MTALSDRALALADRTLALLTRRPLAIGLALALLASAPTLSLSFQLDDWFHLMAVEAYLDIDAPRYGYFEEFVDHLGFLNLFQFFPDDPALVRRYVASGEYPWWAYEGMHITFWRPISSALGLADYLAFGRDPTGYHAHSILWYLALVAAGWGVMKRAAPGAVGALALALFAIDDTHLLPAGWIANRNALVAGAFGLLGLAAHLRWREEGWRPGAALAPLALAAALGGGESALGAFAYVGAYELLGARGPLIRRAAALLPALSVAGIWAWIYGREGYGAYGSGLYLDPRAEPGLYLAAATERLPILLGGLLGPIPSELGLFVAPLRPILIAQGLACAAGLAWLIRPAWPGLDPALRRGLRWLLPGAVLSILPTMATEPNNRLLLFAGLGGAALIATAALVCRDLLARWGDSGWGDRARGSLIAPIALTHLALAVLGFWGGAAVYGQMTRLGAEIRDAVALDPEGLADDAVLVLVASDPSIGIYLPFERLALGDPMPRTWHTMIQTPGDHTLSRVDATTLRLQIGGSGMMDAFFEQLFRGPEHPLEVGDAIHAGPMTVQIEAAEGHLVREISMRFDAPLDQGVRLLTWRDGGLRAVAMPAVGESVVLSWSPGPMGL